MQQRRQAGRTEPSQVAPADPQTRVSLEHRRQRLVTIIGVTVVALALLIVLVGFYVTKVQPPRRTVVEVGPVEIRLGEVGSLARFLLAGGVTGLDDPSAIPQQAVHLIVRNEVLRQRAPRINAIVSGADVELQLVQQFEPIPEDPSESTRVTLSAQGKQIYQDFLELVSLKDETYRGYIEGDLLWLELLRRHDSLTPEIHEQIFLQWVVVAAESLAETIKNRLDEGEDFTELAREFNQETVFSDKEGVVGWVPRGLFPELDEQIFLLESGQPLGPIETSVGVMVLQSIEGPKEMELTPTVRGILVEKARSDWYEVELSSVLGPLDFDESAYDWVIRELTR